MTAATAQEVIHAMAGTVNAIDPSAKTITVITDDGSGGLFKDLTNFKASFDFNKKVRAESIPADVFKNKGNHVIVFYYGLGANQTVVALKDLGTGPFEKTTGSLVKFDKHSRLLTIKTDSGTTESFLVGPETIGDSDQGTVPGDQLDLSRGEKLRVTSAAIKGTEQALFIIQLSF
jgi:hypothetical protein